MAPKHDHVLMPRNGEYLTLHSKMEFGDVIKAEHPEMGNYPELSKLAQSNHTGPETQRTFPSYGQTERWS